jgi:hypothetical protein
MALLALHIHEGEIFSAGYFFGYQIARLADACVFAELLA